MIQDLYALLEEKYRQYNCPGFIADDPISIPHQFRNRVDIEIAGFWVATLAWGQRRTILRSAQQLMGLMGHEPHRFVLAASEAEQAQLDHFVHRTFNGIDARYFLRALRHLYTTAGGLEGVFRAGVQPGATTLAGGIRHFYQQFFALPGVPPRTRKHVPNIDKGAAAKRLNMYLRWMIRKDKQGVDFGLWDLPPRLLLCPLDVHTGRVARHLGLLQRRQDDWRAVCELTEALRQLDPEDPVKYDFALFGLGAAEGMR